MRSLTIILLVLITVACNTKNKSNTKKVEKMEAKKIQVIGNKFKVNFGEGFVFELNFHSETKMTWTPLQGDDKQPHTEDITMVEIRPNVYMIYWKEESGNRIVHVEDFENEIAHTNIAIPDEEGTFYHLNGPLTLIK
ncbi:MoaF N-terminal domain-containing protein [uncultured Psychroserpens sp.]|uniref:MoaF-related domain-containing protein n=1 Tax=uncultured Psychroserpens sp. TaxID=255436 RepID=UPI002633D599|nr:MoaF N-terminal domain-containing protein [uncultured Psychroserpens sp.]